MSSGKNQPIFSKNGLCKVKGFKGRIFELQKSTWEDHIIKDRPRWHLREQFDKVIETLKQPDYILRSPKEHHVVSYVKKYSNLYIWDTVTAIAYLYVLVNLKNNNIRTIYDNPKLKRWECIWPKK